MSANLAHTAKLNRLQAARIAELEAEAATWSRSYTDAQARVDVLEAANDDLNLLVDKLILDRAAERDEAERQSRRAKKAEARLAAVIALCSEPTTPLYPWHAEVRAAATGETE